MESLAALRFTLASSPSSDRASSMFSGGSSPDSSIRRATSKANVCNSSIPAWAQSTPCANARRDCGYALRSTRRLHRSHR